MDTPLSEGEDNTLIDVLINPNAEMANSNIEHKESLKQEIDRSLSGRLLSGRKRSFAFSLGSGWIIR